MLDAICQQCKQQTAAWRIRQAEIHVGQIQNWKAQLCPDCTEALERVILKEFSRASRHQRSRRSET